MTDCWLHKKYRQRIGVQEQTEQQKRNDAMERGDEMRDRAKDERSER